MPLVQLFTNLPLPTEDEKALGLELSGLVAQALGKPEQWVMTRIASAQSMSFAGSHAPCAYLECKSIGLNDAQVRRLAAELPGHLHRQLGIDTARIYIEFGDAHADRWGWNGSTF